MKHALLTLTLLGLAAIAATAKPAQQPQEPTTQITVGQVSLGSAQFMINCYSVPLTIGGVAGTAWVDAQYNGGFILFRPGLEGPDYVTAEIVPGSWTVLSRNTIGQVTSARIAFVVQADPNSDADTDTVQGSITFNFSYTWTGPGRYAGWHQTITGGFGAQSITQD